MGSLLGGLNHEHLVSGQADYMPQGNYDDAFNGGIGSQAQRISNPADATATVKPTVTTPLTGSPVPESATIEAKGYGDSGAKAMRMGTDAANSWQYTKDSTIVHAPFGHLNHSSQEIFDAERHMQNVESNKKTLSRAYDALHGGTGADTTLVK